jgi:hypothetical protein
MSISLAAAPTTADRGRGAMAYGSIVASSPDERSLDEAAKSATPIDCWPAARGFTSRGYGAGCYCEIRSTSPSPGKTPRFVT